MGTKRFSHPTDWGAAAFHGDGRFLRSQTVTVPAGCAGDGSCAGLFCVDGMIPPLEPWFDGRFHPREPLSTAAVGLDPLAGEAYTPIQAVGLPSLRTCK